MKWRAGGIMTQFLPRSAQRRIRAELDPGDAPGGLKFVPLVPGARRS
jgi:molecular chaperone Hsp33